MKETGLKIKLTATERNSRLMGVVMKETGSKISSMVMAENYGLKGTSMLGSSFEVEKKEPVSLIGTTARFIMVISRITLLKVREPTYGQTVGNILDNG